MFTQTDQVMKWIVGVATAAALGIGSWNLSTTTSNDSRISTIEERSSGVRDRLDRIENKLDWLVQERVREYRYSPPSPSEPEAPRKPPRQRP